MAAGIDLVGVESNQDTVEEEEKRQGCQPDTRLDRCDIVVHPRLVS